MRKYLILIFLIINRICVQAQTSIIFSENFETSSWNVPSNLSPAWSTLGNGDNQWHMNTYTTGWTSASGSYSPTASKGSQSVRFHSYDASSGTAGDLISPSIDFSNYSGYPKALIFSIINISGTDKLDVFLSTDGGSTWGNSLLTCNTYSNWTGIVVNLGSSNSNQVKIKLTATSDFGTSDIGIDEFYIVSSYAFVSGSGNFTAPNGVTSIFAECIGGGGSGGRGSTTSIGAGAGGGGAYSRVNFSNLTGGTSILYYSVGSGGTSATSNGSNGISGGDTWVNLSNTVPTSNSGCLAKGGSNGISGTSTALSYGGSGGLATSCFGDAVKGGGNGSNGSTNGAGGGGAGYFSQTNIPSASTITGGIGLNLSGNGGNGSASSCFAGTPFGGGGASAYGRISSGAGANGLILLTYVIPVCNTPTSLSASASSSSQTLSTINGSYTAASSSQPSGYMVVRTSANTQPSPIDGTTYSTGQSALNGYIEYFGTASGNSWTSSSLSPATTYYYWVFSYNNSNCSGGPKYSSTTTNFSQSTLSCPSFNSVININGQSAVPGTSYPTLTAALSDLSSCVITQPITLQLTSNYSSASETFPITINSITGLSVSNTLTIKPASGVTATISGLVSSGALIKFNAADYVTIDGSNSGGVDQSLTITNTATTAPSVISLYAGATNNTIKNCNISSGLQTTLGYGISIGGSTVGTFGNDNDNNTIQNNSITNCGVGIYANGGAAVSSLGMDNLNVIGNSIVYNSTLSSVIGIQIGNGLNSNINQNTIDIQTSASTTPVGISIETGFVSSTINANKINRVSTSSTGGYGGRGITIGGQNSSALTISNNFINGVNGSNYSSFTNSSSMGICVGTIGGSSTLTTTVGGINIYNNTVYLSGSYSYAAICLTAAIYIGSVASSLDIRNNIFYNNLNNTSSTAGSISYSIYSAAANTAYSNINYNNYFGTSGANATYKIGYLGGDQLSLSLWKTASAKDLNSLSITTSVGTLPDLHLTTSTNCGLEGAGTPISGITTDIDGDTRNSSYPDIGADEFSGTNNWSGATSTAWNTTTNWSCSSLPTGSTIKVTIPSSGITNYPILANAVTVNNLNIGSGTLGLNGQTLTINGAITGSGTISGSATSSVVIGTNNAAGTLNFTSGSNTLQNLTLNSGSSATIGNALNITPFGVLTVNSTATLTTGGFLTMKSDITGTARVANSAGLISGDVSVERYIPNNTNRAWRALSVPTYSATQSIANSWQLGTLITGPGGGNGLDQSTGGYSMMTYDPTTDALVGVGNTSNVISNSATSAAAYFLYIRGDRNTGVASSNLNPSSTTLSTKGALYQGSKTTSIAASNTGNTTYHLIGNPYVSPINLNSFYTANNGAIDNTFYLWDPKISNTTAGIGAINTFTWSGTAYIPNVTTGSSYSSSGITEIPSGMAFFVQKSASSTGSVVFNESMKSTGSTITNGYNGLKTASSIDGQLQINLNVSINDSVVRPADGVLAIFDANEKNQVDADDAKKMGNFGENMSIKNQADLLAIEKRPLFNQDTLHLNTTGLSNRPYMLQFNPSKFSGFTQAMLIDHYTQTTQTIPLQSTSVYPFTIDGNAQSKGPNRFDIVFEQSTLQVAATKKLSLIELYPNPVKDGFINISMHQQKEGAYSASIINAMGLEVQHIDWSHFNSEQIHMFDIAKLASGIYYLKLSNEFGDQYMQKFIQLSNN